MRKILLVSLAVISFAGLSGYFAFTSFQNQLWPEQDSVLSIPDSRCSLSVFPDLPQVQLITATLQDNQAHHCKITGRIEDEINFELLLPQDWNGKFVMGGGGGFVGSVVNSALFYGAIKSGYATVGTDTGHVGHGLDASWALNNPSRIENFGHRGGSLDRRHRQIPGREFLSSTQFKKLFCGVFSRRWPGVNGGPKIPQRL